MNIDHQSDLESPICHYTNYESAFHLAHKERIDNAHFGGERYGAIFPLIEDAKICDQTTAEHQAARKDVRAWIRRHPENPSEKAETVVEHFRAIVAPLLEGQATALVVSCSPQDAGHWQEALEKYIAAQDYRIRVEIDGVEEARVGEGQNRIILTTDSLSTGPIESRLCGVYVHQKLTDAEAVATFSQLNETFPGKTTTYLVDFANETDEMLAAFRKVDSAAEISVWTDPDHLLDLCDKLDSSGLYDVSNVDNLIMHESAKNEEKLRETVASVGRRLGERYETTREAETRRRGSSPASNAELEGLVRFRREVTEFLRAYAFLSQLFNYRNTTIGKHALFFQYLLPHLAFVGQEGKARNPH